MLTRYTTNTLLVKETTHYNHENKTMRSKTRNTKNITCHGNKTLQPKTRNTKTLLVKETKHYKQKQETLKHYNHDNIALQ